MKIIRSGGVDTSLTKDHYAYDTDGYGGFVMQQIKPELDELLSLGGSAAICTAGKSDKTSYDRHLKGMGYGRYDLAILGREDEAKWEEYDAVILLGGSSKALYEWLRKTEFSLKRLKKCKLLVGDSVGAHMLAAHTLVKFKKNGTDLDIQPGFMPEANNLVSAHVNNLEYRPFVLGNEIRAWCITNDVDHLELAENELDISEG